MSYMRYLCPCLVVALSASMVSAAPMMSSLWDDLEGYELGMLSNPDGMPVVASTNGDAEWQDFGGNQPNVISDARNHTPGGSKSLLQQLGDDGGSGSDMIMRLNDTIVGGIVTFSVWQFIENNPDFDGIAHLALSEASIQPDGTGFDFGYHIFYDGDINQVEGFCCDPSVLQAATLIKDRWVEIKWEINLNQGTQAISYDGVPILHQPWQLDTRGNGDSFRSIDIWVDGGTTPNARVFYDDFSVQVTPEPASLALVLIAVMAVGRRIRY